MKLIAVLAVLIIACWLAWGVSIWNYPAPQLADSGNSAEFAEEQAFYSEIQVAKEHPPAIMAVTIPCYSVLALAVIGLVVKILSGPLFFGHS